MSATLILLSALLGFSVAAILFLVSTVQSIQRNRTDPVQLLSGPASPGFLMGNSKQLSQDPLLSQKWAEMYGKIYVFRGLLGRSELYLGDATGLKYVIENLPKPPYIVQMSRSLAGSGVVAVEGEDHRRQRKIIGQAFVPTQIRLINDIFIQVAYELKDRWISEMGDDGSRIEVMRGLRHATLDIIGKSGFGYDMAAGDSKSELGAVFAEIFHGPQAERRIFYRLVRARVPTLDWLPITPGSLAIKRARKKMEDICASILAKSRAESELDGGDKRDLLSIMLKANASAETKKRLDDSELIGQIPTFLVAGHHTTSTALGWALYALSMHPEIQMKLRTELRGMPGERPTMDQLNSLPYLDLFIREVLRLYSPVGAVNRMSVADCSIPLSEPYTDRFGVRHESLLVRKDQVIHIPILAAHMDKNIWGDDAHDFRPERWTDLPLRARNMITGVWGNSLAFLAGPRACPAFAFAVLEQKALLFVLVRAFEIRPAVGAGGIGRFTTGGLAGTLCQPGVLADRRAGAQLPLFLRKIQ